MVLVPDRLMLLHIFNKVLLPSIMILVELHCFCQIFLAFSASFCFTLSCHERQCLSRICSFDSGVLYICVTLTLFTGTVISVCRTLSRSLIHDEGATKQTAALTLCKISILWSNRFGTLMMKRSVAITLLYLGSQEPDGFRQHVRAM